jgi:CRISPR-associated protein Csb2
MFALEVEFLTGRVYATDFRERDVPEWPPHPSRLFSALVAALYESGLDSDLRAAPVWLEQQKSPDIWAGSFVTRLESAAGNRFSKPKTPRSFVPINDDYSGKFRNSAGRRKERCFPSGTPDDERVHFIWEDAAPSPATVDALRRIAAQVSYLGHSSSLVRVAVIGSPRDAALRPSDSGNTLLRVASKGRLEYLDAEFARSQGTRQFRPDAGTVQRYARVPTNDVCAPTPASSFGEMIVFQRLNGSPERA